MLGLKITSSFSFRPGQIILGQEGIHFFNESSLAGPNMDCRPSNVPLRIIIVVGYKDVFEQAENFFLLLIFSFHQLLEHMSVQIKQMFLMKPEIKEKRGLWGLSSPHTRKQRRQTVFFLDPLRSPLRNLRQRREVTMEELFKNTYTRHSFIHHFLLEGLCNLRTEKGVPRGKHSK